MRRTWHGLTGQGLEESSFLPDRLRIENLFQKLAACIGCNSSYRIKDTRQTIQSIQLNKLGKIFQTYLILYERVTVAIVVHTQYIMHQSQIESSEKKYKLHLIHRTYRYSNLRTIHAGLKTYSYDTSKSDVVLCAAIVRYLTRYALY